MLVQRGRTRGKEDQHRHPHITDADIDHGELAERGGIDFEYLLHRQHVGAAANPAAGQRRHAAPGRAGHRFRVNPGHQLERHQRAQHDAQHRRHVHREHLPAQADDAFQVDGQRQQHQRGGQEHVARDRVVELGGFPVDQAEGVVDTGNEVAQQQCRHEAVELLQPRIAAARCPENNAQRGGDQAEHDDVIADECACCGCRHR
ncbi:hypothetical protein D3C81_1577770 [compost metagenome]